MRKRAIFIFVILLAATLLSGCSELINAMSKDAPKTLTRGTVSGNVYTSEFANITFTAPEGWVYASDEEQAEMTELGMEVIGEESSDFNKLVMDIQTVNDMMVQNMTTGSNVSVMFENLAMSVGGTSLTEVEYLDATKEVLGDIEALDIVILDDINEVTVACRAKYKKLTRKAQKKARIYQLLVEYRAFNVF